MTRALYLLPLLAPALIFACDDDGDGGTTSSSTSTSTTSSSSGSGGSGGSSGTAGNGGSTSSSGTGGGGGGGGGGGDCVPDPDCEAILGAFSPCGGDITGTWNLTAACHVWGGPGPDPECNDNVVEVATGPAAGTWVFDGTNVAVTGYQVAQTGHSLYSSNCPSTPGDCATIQVLTEQAWPTACCAEIDPTTCECFATADLQSLGDWTAAYSTNGNALTVDTQVAEYCVDGNALTIRYDSATEDEVVQVFEKQ